MHKPSFLILKMVELSRVANSRSFVPQKKNQSQEQSEDYMKKPLRDCRIHQRLESTISRQPFFIALSRWTKGLYFKKLSLSP